MSYPEGLRTPPPPRVRQITFFGDGWQTRDILDVRDLCKAYELAWINRDNISGQAFNIGGGKSNSICLRELVDKIEVNLNKNWFNVFKCEDEEEFGINAETLSVILTKCFNKDFFWARILSSHCKCYFYSRFNIGFT